MTMAQKMVERNQRYRAYRELAHGLAGISDMYRPTASSIFDCLCKAQLSEKYAVSSRLSRAELCRDDPQARQPEELSEMAISGHFFHAASLYGAAAIDFVAASDLPRAFKYFRKAAKQFHLAAEFRVPCDGELFQNALDYKEKTAVIRQEIARRSVLRIRLSLGFLKRLR
jgi:hypothetical protein